MNNEITFGNYKGKPLVWIPVFKNKNIYILKEPITKMQFDKSINYYGKSDVRSYILNDFIPNAFSKEELSCLKRCKYNDLVWLISYQEIKTKGHVNRQIFRNKFTWWLSDCMQSTISEGATMGAFAAFGFVNDVSKKFKCGVRPCIEIINHENIKN